MFTTNQVLKKRRLLFFKKSLNACTKASLNLIPTAEVCAFRFKNILVHKQGLYYTEPFFTTRTNFHELFVTTKKMNFYANIAKISALPLSNSQL